jgi:hypothetical protein
MCLHSSISPPHVVSSQARAETRAILTTAEPEAKTAAKFEADFVKAMAKTERDDAKRLRVKLAAAAKTVATDVKAKEAYEVLRADR